MALGIMSAAKRNPRKNIEEWKVNLKLSLLNKIFGYPSQNVKSVEAKLLVDLNKIYLTNSQENERALWARGNPQPKALLVNKTTGLTGLPFASSDSYLVMLVLNYCFHLVPRSQ